MNKFELIIFSIMAVVAVITTFDFVVFVIKPAPCRAYFRKPIWFIGLICIMGLVYWYMNGMRFA